MLSADEVARSLRGSLYLFNREEEGIELFAVSVDAFWRSFAAIVLTAPAFVTALAADRIRAGLPLQDGLFSDPGLVALRLLIAGTGWIAFPLLMIIVVRRLGLGHRYVGFVVAYNWTAVVVSFVLAIPTALYVLGLASSTLATVYGAAFGILVFRLRWFLVKAALGTPGRVAALIAAADLGLYALLGVAGTSLVASA